MENKNTGLKIMVIILCVLVVGLGGYIVYDKVLSDDKENVENLNGNENNNDLENNQGTNNNNNEVEKITMTKIKEIFEFVYDYQESPTVYCGEPNRSDRKHENYYDYYASTQFTTYNAMLDYLKSYMSTNVIDQKYAFKSTDKDNYIEDKGKLYCNETYKGYPYGYGNINIEIIDEGENKISFVGTMELINMSDIKEYDKVNIVLEKNNNNWIVTSYEKQD